jgi:hypothetical protein
VTSPTDFQDPSAIPSEFASADSFRGRLILIEPVQFERDVPNPIEPGKFADRITANVTTVDGKGAVQQYSNKQPTGTTLAGPVHKGVWFSQDRIVKAVCPGRQLREGTRVLAVLETYKPGKSAGAGNPWGLTAATQEQKAQAAKFLAELAINGASAPADDEESPFG